MVVWCVATILIDRTLLCCAPTHIVVAAGLVGRSVTPTLRPSRPADDLDAERRDAELRPGQCEHGHDERHPFSGLTGFSAAAVLPLEQAAQSRPAAYDRTVISAAASDAALCFSPSCSDRLAVEIVCNIVILYLIVCAIIDVSLR